MFRAINLLIIICEPASFGSPWLQSRKPHACSRFTFALDHIEAMEAQFVGGLDLLEDPPWEFLPDVSSTGWGEGSGELLQHPSLQDQMKGREQGAGLKCESPRRSGSDLIVVPLSAQ